MAAIQRRYDKAEFARRGDEIFESRVRPQLKDGDLGRFAAIDIETGAFEVHADELVASDRLCKRVPDAQIWLVRIGSRYVHRFGGKRRHAA